MIYFIADTHFCHTNILKYANRPFETIEECEDTIINNINHFVQKEDTLIIIGDFCFGNGKEWREKRQRINCENLILVRGNHDHQIPKDQFLMIVDYIEMTICKKKVLVKHYPYRVPWLKRMWRRYFTKGFDVRFIDRRPVDKGHWLIHGHTHSDKMIKDKQICVCVEASKYKPVSMQTIEKIIQSDGNKK
jgi:calcineurin-like phosphoesterase family protein